MAKADYMQLAQDVVRSVGGKENIIGVENCMTRLRFVLKDDSIPNKEEVKKIKGVSGVMNQGGQYQVIIGTHVSEVIKDVRTVAGIAGEGTVNKEDYKVIKNDSLWNRFFKTISGCIIPMLGPMIAGGIIKGILVILTTIGVLASTDGTYQILYAASDSILYFMPIIVGFSCGKVFNCNSYVTAVIGASFLYPDLVTAVAAEGGITFLHIPVASATYANTLLPIILASFLASKVEKLAKRVIPMMVQLMLVPTVVLAISVPISWLIIGPVMNSVSTLLSNGVFGLYALCPIAGGIILGAFWQLVVLLGLHAAFIPVLINNLVTMGYDPVNAVLGLTVWALAGVTLGYALRIKNAEKRSIGFGSMASALCGVTEPAIYSVALQNIKLFGCAMIGGGIAGGIMSALGGKVYTFAGDGLFRIPAMINPEGLDISFYGFIICALIAFGVSGLLAYLMTGSINKKAALAEQEATIKELIETKPFTIYAPVKGTIISQEMIKDQTFATGVLGKGVGIEPVENVIVAPFKGEIVTVAETKHAVAIRSVDGMEVLIHIGMDTVKMNGNGFEVLVKEGDQVSAGQDLIVFDKEQIEAEGYDSVVAVFLTNSDEFAKFIPTEGECEVLDTIATVEK